MSQQVVPLPEYDPVIEERTSTFGHQLFTAMKESSPSIFSLTYWSRYFMALSTRDLELKQGLFKLVTVLPALSTAAEVIDHADQYLNPSLKRLGLPRIPTNPRVLRHVIASCVRFGVTSVAKQFIAGTGVDDAQKHLLRIRSQGNAFTVDMLGEYAVSDFECEQYLARYLTAIEWLSAHRKSLTCSSTAKHHQANKTPLNISVKLSALFPGVHALNIPSAIEKVSARFERIVQASAEHDVDLFVDAEDSVTNQMVYPVFKNTFIKFRDRVPGIVVQGYAKGCYELINDLLAFAHQRGNRIAMRLVKGAYWDSETSRAKSFEQPSPLFSNKSSSDYNFELLTRHLLANTDHCLPAFASHNIRSLAHVMACAETMRIPASEFEFQMLYGMADEIVAAVSKLGYLVRIYTPLGDAMSGMGYLVRRLIENTSNEGFLRHTIIDHDAAATLLAAPHNLG